jgi:hypothetical protein
MSRTFLKLGSDIVVNNLIAIDLEVAARKRIRMLNQHLGCDHGIGYNGTSSSSLNFENPEGSSLEELNAENNINNWTVYRHKGGPT